MIIDEEVYLEHFGKKGMKWGVRKDSSSDSKRVSNKKKAVAVGVLVVGAAFTIAVLKKNGNTPISSIPKGPAAGEAYKFAIKLAREKSALRFGGIEKAKAAGKISTDQHLRLLDLNAARQINESNKAFRAFKSASGR